MEDQDIKEGWTPKQLRQWRVKVGWTQQRAADELRIHVYSYRNLELGACVTRPQVRLLAELVGGREVAAQETLHRQRLRSVSAADTELMSRLQAMLQAAASYGQTCMYRLNISQLKADAETAFSGAVNTTLTAGEAGCSDCLIKLAYDAQHAVAAIFMQREQRLSDAEEQERRKAQRRARREGS